MLSELDLAERIQEIKSILKERNSLLDKYADGHRWARVIEHAAFIEGMAKALEIIENGN